MTCSLSENLAMLLLSLRQNGSDMMTKRFYRYIYKEQKGYRIRYKGEHYGYYTDLANALYDRDRLEAVDWDIQTWTELPETPNHYKAMELPEFDSDDSNIYHAREYWTIRKQIDGKLKYFGTFYSLEEAKERRDELERNNWEVKE